MSIHTGTSAQRSLLARTLNDQWPRGWTTVDGETHRFPSFSEYKSVSQYYIVAIIILVCTFGTEPVIMTMMDSPPTFSGTKDPNLPVRQYACITLRESTSTGDTVEKIFERRYHEVSL